MSNPRYWMQTFTGRPFRFDEPYNLDLTIRDISRPLSRIPRFGGHTTTMLSVAEHSLVVYRAIRESAEGNHLLQMHALMHDAHEAFFGDIVSPLKRYLLDRWEVDISEMQATVQTNIMAGLGIQLLSDLNEMERIHEADLKCCKVERDLFMKSSHTWDIDHITYPPHWRDWYIRMSPNEAFAVFTDTFNELKEKVKCSA